MWFFRKSPQGTQDLAAKPEVSPWSFLFTFINDSKVCSVCLACLEAALPSQEKEARIYYLPCASTGPGSSALNLRSSPVKELFHPFYGCGDRSAVQCSGW